MRDGSTRSIALLLLLLMIILASIAILVTGSATRGRMKLELSVASWMTALLFALIPLRGFSQAMRNLPGIPAGSTEGAAINNRGFVVGRTTTAQGELRAFLWSPLTRRGITLAGLRGADASALDLNDACRMVGTGRGPSGQFAALLWKPTATRS